MAFEIGPRQNMTLFEEPGDGWLPARQVQVHERVINGTAYIFGRTAYKSGQVTIQVIVKGKPMRELLEGKRPTDVHYWTNEPS